MKTRKVIYDKRKYSKREFQTAYLNDIVRAYLNQMQISFRYQRIDEDEPTHYVFQVYAFMSEQPDWNWCIIGSEPNKEYLKTFVVDCMSDFKIVEDKYPLPEWFNYDVLKEYYNSPKP